MPKITFTNKVDSRVVNVPAINKIVSADINQLKDGVNLNEIDIATNITNIATNETDIATNVNNISTNATAIGQTVKITGDQSIAGIKTFTDSVIATTQANATNDTTVATTAYVKNLIGEIPAGLSFESTWNADTDTPNLSTATPNNGQFWIVSVNGATNLSGITDWKVGDWAIYVVDGAGANGWQKVDNSSVLDGQGTGQKVALWSGSGDSNTLTNAPISVSGDDVTFLGDVNITEDIKLLDWKKALFGTGNDLEIYHNGTNSRIQDNTGNINIKSTLGNISLFSETGISLRVNETDIAVQMLPLGAVELRHNNAQKLTTTSTGVAVTGDLTVTDDLTITGKLTTNATSGLIHLLNTTNSSGGYLRLDDSGVSKLWIGSIEAITGGSATSYGMYAAGGNDLKFYSSAGLALTLDTSQNATFASSVTATDGNFSGDGGFGTSTPNNKLQVKTDVNGGGITIQRNSSTSSDFADLMFSISTVDSAAPETKIRAIRGVNYADTDLVFITSNTEALRLNSDQSATFASSVTAVDFTITTGKIESTSLTTGNLQVINPTSDIIYVGNNSTKLSLQSSELTASGAATFASSVEAKTLDIFGSTGNVIKIKPSTDNTSASIFAVNAADNAVKWSIKNDGSATFSSDLTAGGDLTLGDAFEIKNESGSYWQRIRTEDAAAESTKAFNFEVRKGSGAYTNLASITNAGAATFASLSGSGNRVVIADATGLLTDAVIGSGLAFDGTTLTAAGGSGGTITGSGTSGKLTKWTGGTSIGNSIMTESASLITVAGSVSATDGLFSTANNDGGVKIIGSSSNTKLTIESSASTSGDRVFAINNNSGVSGLIFQKLNDDYSFSANLLNIKGNGNTLIGSTTDNGSKLQVNGSATFASSVSTGGNLSVGKNTSRGILDLTFSGDGVLSNTTSDYQLILEAPSGTGKYGRNIGWSESTGVNVITSAINAIDEGSSSATGLAFSTGDSNGMTQALQLKADQSATFASSVNSGTHTIQETATNPNGLIITNRNSNQSFSIGVDASAVDDKFFAVFDRTNTFVPFKIAAASGAATFASSVSATDGNFSGVMKSNLIRSSRTDGEIYIQAATSSDFVSLGTEQASNLLRVNGDGNVSINNGDLDVTAGSVSATSGIFKAINPFVRIEAENNSGTASLEINALASNGIDAPTEIKAITDGLGGSSALLFKTASSSGSLTERMRITSGGDVLFGTTSAPNGTSSYGGAIVSAGSSVLAQLRLSSSSTGTSNLANFYNNYGLVGSISTLGQATSFNTSSDYRLKEDLKDFNGLEMISNIPVYDYKWKADESRSFGVMAHELQEVLPYAVNGEKDAEEMQAVDYSKIVPLLIKSIQELTAKVEMLESKK